MARSVDAISLGFLAVSMSVSPVGGLPSPYVVGLGPGNPLPTRVTIREHYNRRKLLASWAVSFGMGLLFGLAPWAVAYLNTVYPNRGTPEGYTHVNVHLVHRPSSRHRKLDIIPCYKHCIDAFGCMYRLLLANIFVCFA